VQFFLRQLSLTGSAIPQSVGQHQIFVKTAIFQSCYGCTLVQRLESDASLLTLRIWPNRWKVSALCDRATKRRGGI